MKKASTIFGILAICILAGFAFGSLTVNKMKAKETEKEYIGKSDIVIENGKMTPEALLSLGRLSDPQLSPDGNVIMYGVSYTSIEENRSCRNLFVCNTDGSDVTRLTTFGTSVSNARWSADGKHIFFVRNAQIWKAPVLTGKGKGSGAASIKLGKAVKISEVPNGVGEFKLSPDEGLIVYTSTIKNPKLEQPSDSDPALDKAQAFATEDLMYRHWDHWVTEIPRTYVSTTGNGIISPESSYDLLGIDNYYELPTEPFGGIDALDWAPDGRHIAYSCRKLTGKQYAFSTNTEIYIHDILTGETRKVTEGGGYDDTPVWSPDGKHLAWISMPRDGYESDRQRLMVCDMEYDQPEEGQSFGVTFSNIRELAASLDRDASGIFWTPKSCGIIFEAMTDGQQALFMVNVEGEPEVKRITPAEWHYDFFSPFGVISNCCGKAGEGCTLLASYYCLDFPTELVAIKPGAICDDCSETGCAAHETACASETACAHEASFTQITHENAHIFDQLTDPVSESVMVETVDHKQMQCWVLYPPHFDPSKQYPAIEIVLGGPQGTCSQDWSYRWCYRLMAEHGYIVIMPNRRGTTAYGQEWKEQISGDYSGLNMQDYLSAGKWMKSQPYVSKLACCGASYGGYSAYMLEGLHGDLFDCFVAHAGIFDEKQLWFTTEEMWFANWDNGGLTPYAFEPDQMGPKGDGITFGGMQQAGAPYAVTPKARHHYASAPSENVTKWHTPILCIHGMMDFRIPYEQGMAAFNAAQMMGVPSKLVLFPEETHWVVQPQNALYWHRTYFEWLDRWMKD